MKASAIARWSSFVAKIHQPLPLSPRESQKLLSLLKSSFQKRLDDIHPSSQSRSKTNTEIHLHTILAAPLFNNASRRQHAGISKHDHVFPAKGLSRIQQVANSPLTYFGDCVSDGTADYEIAGLCLRHEFRKALASPDADLREALKLSGAGKIILDWLRSSGQGGSLQFFRNFRFLKMLIPFVIAEGKESLIWQWLQELKTYDMLRSRSRESHLAIRKMQYHILAQRFGFEMRHGAGLNSALEILSQTARPILFLAGHSSLDDLIGCFIRKLTKLSPSPAITGNSIDSLLHIINDWDTDPKYRRLLVEQYRPGCPNILSALSMLQEYPSENMLTDCNRRRRELIFLSFRVAELLLQDGSDEAVSSASWVMTFLQDHFAKEIGFQRQEGQHDSEQNERSKNDEASNLRLLDALSVV